MTRCVPVEFIRAAGIFYVQLVAQVCKAAAATGCPSCGGGEG